MNRLWTHVLVADFCQDSWPILGSRRLKQNVGKGRSEKRRREGTRQTRKKGGQGRRRRLHTKHGLCPPLGFQWTFLSGIAGGFGVSGFRFLALWFLGFRFSGLGKQGETKNYVKNGNTLILAEFGLAEVGRSLANVRKNAQCRFGQDRFGKLAQRTWTVPRTCCAKDREEF